MAVGIATAQSGGGKSSRPAAAPAKSPACAHVGKSVALPAEVPSALLPPQTILTSVKHTQAGQTLVAGVVSREFRNVVDYYVTQLRGAGYVNGAGDAEMDEAEALFVGPGVSGKWKVNGILNCPQAVTLAVIVKG